MLKIYNPVIFPTILTLQTKNKIYSYKTEHNEQYFATNNQLELNTIGYRYIDFCTKVKNQILMFYGIRIGHHNCWIFQINLTFHTTYINLANVRYLCDRNIIFSQYNTIIPSFIEELCEENSEGYQDKLNEIENDMSYWIPIYSDIQDNFSALMQNHNSFLFNTIHRLEVEKYIHISRGLSGHIVELYSTPLLYKTLPDNYKIQYNISELVLTHMYNLFNLPVLNFEIELQYNQANVVHNIETKSISYIAIYNNSQSIQIKNILDSLIQILTLIGIGLRLYIEGEVTINFKVYNKAELLITINNQCIVIPAFWTMLLSLPIQFY